MARIQGSAVIAKARLLHIVMQDRNRLDDIYLRIAQYMRRNRTKRINLRWAESR